MEDKRLKLLLVEPDPEAAMLLKESLMEIEERQFGRPWSPIFQPVHVERLSDAVEVLSDERFDVTLLDVVLPDSHSLHAFLRLKGMAPEMSIIMLADEDDEALAVSAVREGAQDYLVKSELECAPLARALRHAIERQRLTAAARSASYQDSETGLYNRFAFQSLGLRDFRLAKQLGCDLQLVVVSLDGLDRIQETYGRSERRMMLMDAAETMRESCRETDIVGRLDDERFAVATLGTGTASAGVLRKLRAGFRDLATRRGGKYPPEVIFGSASLRDGGDQQWEELLATAEGRTQNAQRAATAC